MKQGSSARPAGACPRTSVRRALSLRERRGYTPSFLSGGYYGTRNDRLPRVSRVRGVRRRRRMDRRQDG